MKYRDTKPILSTSILASLLLVILVVFSSHAGAQESQVSSLESRIPLPNVKGRIDHFSVDLQGQRFFLAAVDNHTLEVIDLKSGRRVNTIADLAELQKVFYDPSTNHPLVACALDGVTILDGSTVQVLATVKFPDDADNILYDPHSKRVIVGYAGAKQLRKRERGTGGLGFLDLDGRKDGDVVIDAHPMTESACSPVRHSGRLRAQKRLQLQPDRSLLNSAALARKQGSLFRTGASCLLPFQRRLSRVLRAACIRCIDADGSPDN